MANLAGIVGALAAYGVILGGLAWLILRFVRRAREEAKAGPVALESTPQVYRIPFRSVMVISDKTSILSNTRTLRFDMSTVQHHELVLDRLPVDFLGATTDDAFVRPMNALAARERGLKPASFFSLAQQPQFVCVLEERWPRFIQELR